MKIKLYKTKFLQQLSSLYDEKEVESFFYLILEKLHNLKRIDLALHPEVEMDEKQFQMWETIVADLKKQKPIQYILGETEFYGLPFLVNENTLIPRPETEELVQLIIDNSKSIIQHFPFSILDIGTGTGCIPIALKMNLPIAEVFAIDVSENALEVAKINAARNNVEVVFWQKDILKTTQLGQQFDVIVSNPPYVRHLEKTEIKPNVLEYEPHLALFVADDDPLIFYRKIAELAKNGLKTNGQLYFEINQYLGKETVALLDGLGFKNIQLIKDVYGNDRIICCHI